MTEQMLRQYTVLVEYLGATLGPDYEVVLHEILPETSRVAAIANGTISGRSVGAPITNAALRMIMQKQYETSDYNLNYTGQLANGKTIRSSTMFIKACCASILTTAGSTRSATPFSSSSTRTILSITTTSLSTRPPSSPCSRSTRQPSRRSISNRT